MSAVLPVLATAAFTAAVAYIAVIRPLRARKPHPVFRIKGSKIYRA